MHPLEPNNPAFFDCGFIQRIQNGKNEIAIAALTKLLDSIAHPIDLPALLAVAKGALISFDSALSLIRTSNSAAREIRGQLQVLSSTLIDLYQDLEVHDLKSTLHRRLADFQGWKTLAEVGFAASDTRPTAAVVGLGLNLGLALSQKKTMAAAYCRNLRRDLSNSDAQIDQLIHRPAGDPVCDWHAQFYKFWIEFQTHFSETPTEPEPPLNIHQASLSSWIGRAAFPSDRRRTAILDSTCLSKQQVTIALSHDGAGVFSDQLEYQLALWLIGFSGAPVEMAHLIPIEIGSTATNDEDDWIIFYDAESMSLKRDYSRLAKDAAMPSKAASIEASFIHCTVLPESLSKLIKERFRSMKACTFGDIVPALKSLKSEGFVYPSVNEIKPTWARWARTLGTLAFQTGDDAFLAAATFGDYGLCAKSKLFYVTVSASESYKYQLMLYRRLGWLTLEQPCQSGLNFGARIVPTDATLRSLDQYMVLRLKEMRPARRRSVAAVVDFHNFYTALLAFRWMLRLSLRSASEFSIFADIYPEDLTTDLNEKSSQGRKGSMAAPLTAGFHEELKNYRLHIAALGSIPSVTSAIPGLKEWSQQVANYQPVPLVRTIQIDRGMSNCSSKEALRVLQLSDRLAPDFGRKWTENAARLAGFTSLDIDRLLRHEVRGQESTGSISEGSEYAWCMRVSSALNALHEQVLSGSFHGLRSSK
jgi:hypothetical protein